jgi:hypothetical protein
MWASSFDSPVIGETEKDVNILRLAMWGVNRSGDAGDVRLALAGNSERNQAAS